MVQLQALVPYGVMDWENTHEELAVGFRDFFTSSEPTIRRALIGRFGPDLGREAAAESFAVVWKSWGRVSTMANPSGYTYRVGQRWAARQQRLARQSTERTLDAHIDHTTDVDLADALQTLSPRQRQVVILVEGFAMTHAEVAGLLGCKRTTVQNHLERGLARLRAQLEADHATS